jgi:PUA domain protein
MRKQLNRTEKEEFAAAVKNWHETTKKDNVETTEGLYYVNGAKNFAKADETMIPTLNFLITKQVLPAMVVDMGAVRFVTSGADVMRPGIRTIPAGLQAGDIVCIVDEKHGKPLAVGKMLLDSTAAQGTTTGKIVRNLHWVGDKIWSAQ